MRSDIGKEIVVYENKQDAIEKAAYYLAHEDERRRIAEAGKQRVLKDHTVGSRVAYMLDLERPAITH